MHQQHRHLKFNFNLSNVYRVNFIDSRTVIDWKCNRFIMYFLLFSIFLRRLDIQCATKVFILKSRARQVSILGYHINAFCKQTRPRRLRNPGLLYILNNRAITFLSSSTRKRAHEHKQPVKIQNAGNRYVNWLTLLRVSNSKNQSIVKRIDHSL